MLSDGPGAMSSSASNAESAVRPHGAPCQARSSAAKALRGVSP